MNTLVSFRKIICAMSVALALVLFLSGAFSIQVAHALTEDQITAVTALLGSFGVSQTVISNVETTLRGGVSAGPYRIPPPTVTPVLGVEEIESEVKRYRICDRLAQGLSRGSRGDDVRRLQEFLREQGHFNAEVTDFFGPITERALQQFQEKEGVVRSGAPHTTGWGVFGPRTRNAIKKWCDVPAPQQKLSAHPQKGPAPLVVNFVAEGTASVWTDPRTGQTVAIADAGEHYIDFGDGSPHQRVGCQNPTQRTCKANITHTYTQEGSYTAVLFNAGYFGVQNDDQYGTRHDIARVHIKVQNDVVACTQEYKPVCGRPVGCANTCPPGQVCTLECRLHTPQTYGNKCSLRAAGAEFLHEGQCRVGDNIPNQCRLWHDGCNDCSRSTPGGPLACTKRACFTNGPAYCKEFFSNDENKRPVIHGFSGPTTLAIGEVGTWKIDASDPEGGSLKYSIRWGDEGLFAQALDSAARALGFTQTTTFTHSYSQRGTYTIHVVVTDDRGKSAETSATVQVGEDLVMCTADALQCPDGSWVGRTGPNCVFECPNL